MKRRIAALLLSAALVGTLIGCGGTAENAAPSGETADTAESAADVIEESAAESAPVTDESGEADAEDEENYETGDASLDDPGNQDEIGENEILVVSFGTSFNDSRRLTIGAIENAIREAFPEWSVRRAFTSQIIIDHVNKRDGVKIDNVKEALDRAVENGVKNLIVQPTHLMAGLEYHDLEEEVMSYADAFESITMGENLLAEDGDFEEVAKIITARTAEYDDGETAICFMGHGTEAESNAVYAKMQEVLTADGFENYFVGTVEATPSLEDVMAAVGEGEYKRVVLMPLMVVAGDHANNDMAGDEEDSWKSQFEAEGYSVECVLEGLGQQPEIQQLYVEHLQKFVESALAE
jgi:sirohydrochlorin cobaltochelatase